MCRLAIIPKEFKDEKFLKQLFTDLDKSMGGDGEGVGYFKGGIPTIFKGEKITSVQMSKQVCDINSDGDILYHCRRASIGNINDENCHPYIYNDTITAMNGHIDGANVLKLMMLETLDKYRVDGWTEKRIMSTTDSDLLAYFIYKRGFDIAQMMECGTIITMYTNHTRVYVGYCLQAIYKDDVWIYASEFSDKMGMAADRWVVFARGSNFIIQDNVCIFQTGYCIDGKELYKENQKINKKNKKNDCLELVDVV